MKRKRPHWYAVARGRAVGVYETWADCERQVKGFSGPRRERAHSREPDLGRVAGVVESFA